MTNPGMTVLSLELSRATVFELGGFRAQAAPPLLDARGGWAVHAGLAFGVAVVASVVALLFLEPASRVSLLLAIMLALSGLAVLAICEAERLAVAFAIAGLVALAHCIYRVLATPLETWGWVVGSGAVAAGTFLVVARAHWRHQRRAGGFVALARLHAEVNRFNDLVGLADVTERLAATSGQEPSESERLEVLYALHRTRAELVRALRMERLMRENHGLLRSAALVGDLALVPDEAARVQIAAEGCSLLARDALLVAARVREELQSLARLH